MSELRPIHYTNLERKGKYIVKTENGIYKGIYLTQPLYFFPYIVLSFVTKNVNGKKYKLHEALFQENDIFYDAEEYINEIKEHAKKAIQQMESRALNKILKGVVNDEFQWL
jgi:hypothetical protein